MNFNSFLKTIFFSGILTFFSCLGENSWEDLESDYDHVLNVFGLVSLDSLQPSYVGLYSTTDLDEISRIFVGVDTLGWCDCDDDECGWGCEDKEIDGYWILDSLFEPAALIKNASVIITDDNGNNYDFSYVENIAFVDTIYFDTTVVIYGTTIDWDTTIFDTNNLRINLYIDSSGTFNPEPMTTYNLNINAPGYDPVTGSLTTPNSPSIDSLTQLGINADTVIINEPFNIYWDLLQEGKALVTGEVLFGNWWDDSLANDWCGGYFDPFVVDLSDNGLTPYTIYPWICSENLNQGTETRDYIIRITAMDENYYDYFVVGESGEYSNALLNYPTTKGRSVGIQGGFGFFGSIASDRLLLKIAR